MVQKKSDPPGRLSLFDRPLASGLAHEPTSFYDYLTFKNIVVGLGVVALMIVLGRAVSVQAAFLSGSIIALLLLLLAEIGSRRRWEQGLINQLDRMNGEYERLVRDVARTRNDAAGLRRKIAEAAGTFARTYDKTAAAGSNPIEQRMVRGIIEQLTRIDEVAHDPEIPHPEVPVPLELVGKGQLDEASIGKRLNDEQVMQLVNGAVKNDRIDLFLQPIVNLPQRKTRFYEMFSRIRVMPDVYLPATRYIDLAIKQDLMPVIDNLLLLRGLQMIRAAGEADYNRAYFFNITSSTLNDPKFMGDLVEFISQNRALAPQLVFELGQRDLSTMSADVLPTLEGLSKLGCRFSMDQVRNLSFDPVYLETRHIRFIKMDAPMLLAEMHDEGGLQNLKRLKAELDRSGIDLIAEKIESERQLLELLDIEIDYGQGYLFGRPTLHERMP